MSRRLLVYGLMLPTMVLAADPAPTPALARELAQAHRYPEAQAVWEQLAAAHPADPSPHYHLGRLAMQRNDFAVAIAEFQAATRLDPANSGYFAELGGAYGGAADHGSVFDRMASARLCHDALLEAVRLDPGNLEARAGLVQYYSHAPGFLGGGWNKACAEAQLILARDAVRGTFVLGRLYIQDHRYDEADAVYEQLLQQQPDNYQAHYAIGRLAARSGHNLAAGARHLQRCIELTPGPHDPSHAQVFAQLGSLREQQHDPAAARREYEQALRLDPKLSAAAQALTRLPAAPPAMPPPPRR